MTKAGSDEGSSRKDFLDVDDQDPPGQYHERLPTESLTVGIDADRVRIDRRHPKTSSTARFHLPKTECSLGVASGTCFLVGLLRYELC